MAWMGMDGLRTAVMSGQRYQRYHQDFRSPPAQSTCHEPDVRSAAASLIGCEDCMLASVLLGEDAPAYNKALRERRFLEGIHSRASNAPMKQRASP